MYVKVATHSDITLRYDFVFCFGAVRHGKSMYSNKSVRDGRWLTVARLAAPVHIYL